MSLVAVADTGPLIHLAEIDALDLLDLLDELLVPKTVYAELDSGGIPDGFEAVSFDLIDVETGDREWGSLDSGERAALSLALEKEAILLTDDLAARERAAELGVAVHGSIGIVALGANRGAVSEDNAVDLMRSLQHDTSLYVSEAVVDRGIDRLRDR